MWGIRCLLLCSFISFNLHAEDKDQTERYISSVTKQLQQIQNKTCNTYDCHYLHQNLRRDQLNCNAAPEVAFSSFAIQKPTKIVGKINYAGVWAGKYSYELSYDDKQNINYITVKIFFNNKDQVSSEVYSTVKNNLKHAQNYWNEANPLDQTYEFRFVEVSSKKEADFSVKLMEQDTRGPYYSKWSSAWDRMTTAHEVGHMLGLDDEYGTVMQHRNCDSQSLMCLSSGYVRPYHFYQIFKRVHCV